MSRNSLIKYVLSLCLTAMCWMTMAAEETSLRGDVYSDGTVNISDVTSLIDYLLNSDSPNVNKSAADVDDDGTIGISDVTALIDFLLSGEWPYVPETLEFTVSGVTFKMIPVVGGTFIMGGSEDDPYVKPWELPAHEVTLSDYYIGETEVTQALWRAVMGSNPSWFCSTNGYTNDLKRPVEKVKYSDCTQFLSKLKQKTGKAFRLLTDAEWEYAARGGKRAHGYMYSGGNDIDEVAWHAGNSDGITHAVGNKAPNELGIYDMAGNVGEWCSDWFGYYSAEAQTNPTGPTTGDCRVVRGGSWNQAWRMNRVSYRYDGIPTSTNVNIGLRLALSM